MEVFTVTRLKLERQNRKISQARLAHATRIAQPVISQIENGRLVPMPSQLARLAAVFGVLPEDLLAVLGPSR